MTAFLEHEDLWKCIEGAETDERKLAKAKAKLILCIDPINYSHIQSATNAKEVWEKLKASFEDSGLTRKVSLLRTMATTRLEKCSSVDDYVNEIVTTAHKLSGLGFPVSDEWVGTLLLAGLPEEYRPMIMGIESSGMAITADAIKTKILQDVKDARTSKNSDNQNAFFAKKNKKAVLSRCYNCNARGHFANRCPNKEKKSNYKTDKSEGSDKASTSTSKEKTSAHKEKAFIALLASPKDVMDKAWYVDSCASAHITNQEFHLQDKRTCKDVNMIVANKDSISVKATGSVSIPVLTETGVQEVKAKNVMYVPGSAANLLSVSEMVNKGLSVIFTPSDAYIEGQDGERMATMTLEHGIYTC